MCMCQYTYCQYCINCQHNIISQLRLQHYCYTKRHYHIFFLEDTESQEMLTFTVDECDCSPNKPKCVHFTYISNNNSFKYTVNYKGSFKIVILSNFFFSLFILMKDWLWANISLKVCSLTEIFLCICFS